MRGARGFLVVVAFVAVGAAAVFLASRTTPSNGRGAATGSPSPGGSGALAGVVVAAAGDIACDPSDENFAGGDGTEFACRMKATSDLLVAGDVDAVLGLGDLQYEDGSLAKYPRSYDPTWGRVKAITYPAAGNHEYGTVGARGYFAYWGARAGERSRGYYSFDLGAWHVIALNSNCVAVRGCGAGSPQERWLREDLAAHPAACTLAFWHHPRFSSGGHGSDDRTAAFWRALHEGGVDVVLNGHEHDYERFAPQDPSGSPDPDAGIRQFIVGTGGKNTTPFLGIRRNSERRRTGTFGVLRLTLKPGGYDYAFAAVPPDPFTDAGSGRCH